MRLREFFQPEIEVVLTEAEARIQHAEDLVFWEGSKGASRALNALKSLEGKGHQKVTIKWDGCVHPESIIKTNEGFESIQSVIDKVNEGTDVSVLQYDFESESLKFKPILNAVKKDGVKEWYQVELDNGDTITLTADHEVYTTNRGWVAAQNLTSEDDIQHITKQV